MCYCSACEQFYNELCELLRKERASFGIDRYVLAVNKPKNNGNGWRGSARGVFGSPRRPAGDICSVFSGGQEHL